MARALAFFGDAERESAFPAGLAPRKWGQIKRFFRTEAPGLLATTGIID